jgi:hypothetical protein
LNPRWKTKEFFRMWPRALFHMKAGKPILERHFGKVAGVYVLYRDDVPHYIGKTGTTLLKRLRNHALKPNTRRYNFWNYFSAFSIADPSHRDEVEAILISAMPTANSATPKITKVRLKPDAAKLLNNIQALMLTGEEDSSGVAHPERADEDDDT